MHVPVPVGVSTGICDSKRCQKSQALVTKIHDFESSISELPAGKFACRCCPRAVVEFVALVRCCERVNHMLLAEFGDFDVC